MQALIEAVRARYELPRRWYRLKAQMLGIDRLADYDRMAAVTQDNEKVPWPEAKEIVLDAYSTFSDDLGTLVERFFDESWIDGPVRQGKRGGAFCSYGTPSVHPYVMLNYTYLRRDVLTLAHELGHGVHAALGAGQGVFHMATPLTLAETASVFGETLVFGRLLEASPTPESRLSLLAESIEGSIATVFRQVAMNRFEDLVHTTRRDEGELSVDRFGSLWAQSQEELLGDAVEVTEGYRTWWSYVTAFRRHAGLRVRVRLRAAARAGGLRPLRGGGPGVRVVLPRPAERRRLAQPGGARADRRRRPRRPGLLGQGPGSRRTQAGRGGGRGARSWPYLTSFAHRAPPGCS